MSIELKYKQSQTNSILFKAIISKFHLCLNLGTIPSPINMIEGNLEKVLTYFLKWRTLTEFQ